MPGYYAGYPTGYATPYSPGSGDGSSIAPIQPATGYFTGYATPYRTPYDPGSLGPIAPVLPYDLAEAIVARFATASSLGEITKIYESEGGDRREFPYLVYTIKTGATILTSDVHHIYDQRVSFKVHAADQPTANQLREEVHKAFGKGAYDFQTGFSIPFFQMDRNEAKHNQRGKNGEYVFWAAIDYSARTHRG